jgi:hypothetical protein
VKPKGKVAVATAAAAAPVAVASGPGPRVTVTPISAIGTGTDMIESFASFDARGDAVRALHAVCAGTLRVTSVVSLPLCQVRLDGSHTCQAEAFGECRTVY